MTRDDIANEVIEIIADKLQKPSKDEITDDLSMIEDLGASSLDIFDLLTDFEENFEIDIDDEANTLRTVGDVISYINKKVNEKDSN